MKGGMLRSRSRPQAPINGPRGFVLATCILLLSILTLLAVGLLSLSSVQLRSSQLAEARSMAEANARLALVEALGQLQRHLGPDQRVSAEAGLLSDAVDPHWVGVWSSIDPSGESIWRRDEKGSWRDLRSSGEWDRESQVRKWLVSGDESPGEETASRVTMVGEGSVESGRAVTAPLVEVEMPGRRKGRFAWWVGGLGVRANLAVSDPYSEVSRRQVGQ